MLTEIKTMARCTTYKVISVDKLPEILRNKSGLSNSNAVEVKGVIVKLVK